MTDVWKLEVRGYGGRVLHPTMVQQPAASDHLAILFPGRAYTCQMPLLYYASLLVRTAGADVMLLQHDYRDNPALSHLPEHKLAQCMEADVGAAYAAAFSRHRYRRLTLIGKSLGCMALSLLPRAQPLPSVTRAVWLTPPLLHEGFVEHLSEWSPPSMLAIGTADLHFDDGVFARLTAPDHVKGIVLPDADHSLEVPGDFARTLQTLTAVVAAMAKFLGGADGAR